MALDLDGDLYSMLFVLCIRPEYHFYYMNIAGKEFDLPLDTTDAALDTTDAAPDATDATDAAPDAAPAAAFNAATSVISVSAIRVFADKSNAEEDLRSSANKTIENMYGKLPDQTLKPEALVKFAKQILETKKVLNKSFSEIISQTLVIWIFQITICGLIFNETREI